MEQIGLPLAGYVFIGITTLVLTYVTIMDTSDITDKTKKIEPTTAPIITLPTLPSIQSLNPFASTTPAVAVPILPSEEQPSLLEKINPFATENPVVKSNETTAAPVIEPNKSTTMFGNLFGNAVPPKKIEGGRKKKTKMNREKNGKKTKRSKASRMHR